MIQWGVHLPVCKNTTLYLHIAQTRLFNPHSIVRTRHCIYLQGVFLSSISSNCYRRKRTSDTERTLRILYSTDKYFFGLYLRATPIANTHSMPLTVSTKRNTEGNDQTLVLCVLLLHPLE